MENDEKTKNVLLYLADQMSVLIACRVSPKQKADIVEMVKLKFPQKTMLSIGDGANVWP